MRISRAVRVALVLALITASASAGRAWRQAAPSPQTPPPVEGTGAISGVVTDGSTAKPMAGAIVSISAPVSGMPGPNRQLTDGQGRFVFTRLPANENFTLTAAKRGYFAGRFGQPEPTTGVGRRIGLTEGQWFSDARIVLWRSSAISGTVTDEVGEPVVGTFVRVLSQVMVAGRQQLAGGLVAKTDDRGRYRVAGLSKGRYMVTVPSVQATVPADMTLLELAGFTPENVAAGEASGRPLTIPDDPAVVVDQANRLIVGRYPTPPPVVTGRAQAYPVTFFPAARTVADAASIDLSYSEERQGIDIRLNPAPAVRVSGIVQGPPDAQAAGMTLRLLPSGSESLGFGSEAATSKVAPNGSFTLLNVPAGKYTILVSRSMMEYLSGGITSLYATPAPPGYERSGATGGGAITSGSAGTSFGYRTGGNTSYSARMTLAVGDRDLTDVIVPLKRAVKINGRFEWESGTPETTLQRQTEMGTPIRAVAANGDPALGMPSGDTTRGDPTRFSVDGLQPGQYTLDVTSFGGRVKSIVWEGRDYTHRPFDAIEGRDFENVLITLTTRVARLNGAVHDSRGASVDHASLIVFPVERDQWSGYGLRPSRIVSAAVSSRGAFDVASLPAGEYFAIAVDDGLADAWQDPRFLETAAAQATRVVLAWGETKTVDLTLKTVRR